MGANIRGGIMTVCQRWRTSRTKTLFSPGAIEKLMTVSPRAHPSAHSRGERAHLGWKTWPAMFGNGALITTKLIEEPSELILEDQPAARSVSIAAVVGNRGSAACGLRHAASIYQVTRATISDSESCANANKRQQPGLARSLSDRLRRIKPKLCSAAFRIGLRFATALLRRRFEGA